MIGTIIGLIFLFGVVFFIYNHSKPNNTFVLSNDMVVIDGKLITFEQDYSFLQRIEDQRYYRNYEGGRLLADRQKIHDDYFMTVSVIQDFQRLKDCVNESALDEITDKYNEYVLMCEKLGIQTYLSKEQFLIKDKNPMYCCDFRHSIRLKDPKDWTYNVYDSKTAKYLNKADEILAQEFKERNY